MASNERFKFMAQHTARYSVSEMCCVLGVTRQRYKGYKKSLDKLPKHAALLAEINAIIEEDEFNNAFRRERIYDALVLKSYKISLSTVYRICRKYGFYSIRTTLKALQRQLKLPTKMMIY